ncbi:MAG: hypothetical protein AAGH64_03880 [Planctomycetota bacterium]
MGYLTLILGIGFWLLSIGLLVSVRWLVSVPEYMRCRVCGYTLDGVHERSRACPECGGRKRGIAGLTRGEANCARVLAIAFAMGAGYASYKVLRSDDASGLLTRWTTPASARMASDRAVLRDALSEWSGFTAQQQQQQQQHNTPHLNELERRLASHTFTRGTNDPFFEMLVEEMTSANDRNDPGLRAVSGAVWSRMLLARQNNEIDAGQFGRVIAAGAILVVDMSTSVPYDGVGLLEREWSYELGLSLVQTDPGWVGHLRGGGMTWEALDMFPYRGDLLHFDTTPVDGSSRPDAPVLLSETPYDVYRAVGRVTPTGGSGTITLTDGANYRIANDLVFELYEPSDVDLIGPLPGVEPVAVFVIPARTHARVRVPRGMGSPFRTHP